MTRLAVPAFLALAALAPADRVITVPTARKIPAGTVRYEFRGQAVGSGVRENLLGIGLNQFYELEMRTSSLYGKEEKGTFDFSYNVVAPIPEISPGISFGVQDVLDETEDRRRYYGAITFRPIFSTVNGDVAGEVTLGIIQGEYTHPFVGAVVPFSREFRLLAEHNGFRPAAGFEVRPRADLGLRFQVREGRTLVGLQYTRKF
jgi:hypothetical protein